MNTTAPILYFGCIGQPGHYLHDKTKSYDEQPRFSSTPWRAQIDAGVFKDYSAGKVYHAQKDGWSLIYMADYSVDSRPGSHSTFVTKSLMTKDELVAAARIQWPEVFGRKRFPVLS